MLTIGLLLSRTCWVDLVNFSGLYENLPAQLSVSIAKHLNWAKLTDRPPLVLPECSHYNYYSKNLDRWWFSGRDIEGIKHVLKRVDEGKGVELTVLDLDDDQVVDSLPMSSSPNVNIHLSSYDLTFFRWVCTRAISRTKILSCSWRRTPPSSCQTSTTSSACFKRFPCTLTLALVLQYIYHFSGFPFLTTETFASHTTQQQSPKQMSITTYKSFENWNVQGVSSKKDFLFEIWQLQYSECCFLNATHIFSNSVLCKQMILSMKKTSLT